MTQDEKVRINAARRHARESGLVLKKAWTKNVYDLTHGGFQLIRINDNEIVLGRPTKENFYAGYDAKLDEVEAYLLKHNQNIAIRKAQAEARRTKANTKVEARPKRAHG
jgi:hypothetical protein